MRPRRPHPRDRRHRAADPGDHRRGDHHPGRRSTTRTPSTQTQLLPVRMTAMTTGPENPDGCAAAAAVRSASRSSRHALRVRPALPAAAPKHPSATTAMVLGIIGLAGILTCGGVTLVLRRSPGRSAAEAVKEIDAARRHDGGREQAHAAGSRASSDRPADARDHRVSRSSPGVAVDCSVRPLRPSPPAQSSQPTSTGSLTSRMPNRRLDAVADLARQREQLGGRRAAAVGQREGVLGRQRDAARRRTPCRSRRARSARRRWS